MSAIIELYILLRIFSVPAEYGNLLSIVFAGVSVLVFLIGRISRILVIENSALSKNFILLAVVYVVIVFISKYSILYTSEVFATALICFIYFVTCRFKGVSKVFRSIAFISIVVQTVCFILFGTIGVNHESFSLLSLGDKGSSSFVIFLLTCLEWRRKRYWKAIVYIVCSIFTAFGGGANVAMNRTALLLIILFGFVVLLEMVRGSCNNFWIVEHSGTFFILSSFGIILISYGWLAITAIVGVGDYHTSIFDTSNNIRVISNIYVWQQFKSTPELIIYGYDRDIYDAMSLGVGTGFLNFMGTRVVQAHHSILNLYQRCGLIFTTVYFSFIAKFIERSSVSDKNRVLLPVFMVSMVMHSYLQTECLLLLAMVLYDAHESAYVEIDAHPFRFSKKGKRIL